VPEGARDRARRVARRCITSPSILIALVQSALLPKDFVVSPAVTRAHVRERCARGEAVEFREYPASGHVDVIGAAGDAALAWTQERLAGRPAPMTCPAGVG
jgi:hypothetical protein